MVDKNKTNVYDDLWARKEAEIDKLKDRIMDLEDSLALMRKSRDDWCKAWEEEYALRTKKRSFLDKILGYIG